MENLIRFGQDERYLKMIQQIYGYRRVGGALFPLSVKGQGLISVPFFEYGGLLADSWTKKEILEECHKLLKETKTKYIEVHGGGKIERKYFTEKEMHQSAIKKLPGNLSNLWESLSYQVQKTIKQSEKQGVICRLGRASEMKNIFYPMYQKWTKRLGSPVLPIEHFTKLNQIFKNDCWLIIAEKDDLPLACLLGVVKDKTINLYSCPSIDLAKKYRANDAAHYFLMKVATKRRLAYCDFGVIRYEGQRHFKEKWGVKLLPYSYWYYSSDPNFTVPKPLDPEIWYFKSVRWIWRYLIPEKLANLIGPIIRKWLMI